MMNMPNPIQLMNMKRNPQAFIQNILNSNPNIKGADKLIQAINLANNGDTQGLQKLANDICEMQGTTSDMVGSYVKNSLGIQ